MLHKFPRREAIGLALLGFPKNVSLDHTLQVPFLQHQAVASALKVLQPEIHPPFQKEDLFIRSLLQAAVRVQKTGQALSELRLVIKYGSMGGLYLYHGLLVLRRQLLNLVTTSSSCWQWSRRDPVAMRVRVPAVEIFNGRLHHGTHFSSGAFAITGWRLSTRSGCSWER